MNITISRFFLCLAPILALAWLCASAASAASGACAVNCLKDINAAIDNGDSAAFARLVDVDAILDNALEVFLQEAAKPENASQLPPMLTLMLSQAAGQDAVRKLLLGEFRAFALSGIASGAFAGKKLDNAQQRGLLAPLFANASIGRKEIRNIGEPMEDGEGGWLVPFAVHDFGNDNDYGVIGRIGQGQGGWRLSGVENLDQIFAQIANEARKIQ